MSHAETTHTDNYQMEDSRWATGRNTLALAALISVVLCIVGYVEDPLRLFRSYIVAFSFVVAIGLGAFFFVMVQFLSGSAWSVTVRRIMENIMITLPFCALLFIPVVLGLRDIYAWMDPANAHLYAVKVKGVFFTENFYLIRAGAYFLVWSIWIFSIYRQSTKQDTTKSIRQMHIASRWSAPGLFLAIAVGTLASWDWIMSVEPGWYSTIFGLYILSGGAWAFMGIVTLVALGFRRAGVLKNSITLEHYHDLGKWLLALTAFYTYMAFAQYLLIWYANLPEETAFYRHRIVGGWLPIALSLPFIRFIIPFFGMLCRPVKRNLNWLGFFAAWGIVTEYVDLYWVIMPAYYKNGPQLHWLDLATLGATISLCGLVFWSRFKKHKMVPVGDLRFEQSLHFENA